MHPFATIAVLSALCCGIAAAQDPQQLPPNLIESLPFLDVPLNFSQYSGYITVNQTEERALFYWFVESQNDPANDPVLLWLQGGPGCAGTYALFEEHGPYRIGTDKQLYLNEWSWNKLANVIFIDAPAGVGFSYSNTSQGLNTGDAQAAQDNYHFLQGFFSVFPSFASNDLWITGESYGGVYVPTLVDQILTGSDTQLQKQLKGFTVGNPVINCPALYTQGRSTQVDMFYYHGMISYQSRAQWYNSSCDTSVTESCLELYNTITESIGHFSGDDLYTNFCTGNGTLDAFEEVPNCSSLSIRTEWYLNNPDVQVTLGVDIPWISCTFGLVTGFNYTKSHANMLDYYNKFFDTAPDLRILIFSGDIDIDTVPHSQTQLCLSSLNRPTEQAWGPWTIQGPAIPNIIPGHVEKSLITAGYVEQYDSYTYATVKGAGHEVPLYQPHLAYELFKRFVVNGSDNLSS